MPHECPRQPRKYTHTEWQQLTVGRRHVMIPLLFEDLLAPNLPVDAMRVLRYLWFRTWGRVQPGAWMPPHRIAECLPEWATEAAMRAKAYSVMDGLWESAYEEHASSTSSPTPYDEWNPSYREERRQWGEAWAAAEASTDSDEFREAVATYEQQHRRGQFYPNLMSVTVTQRELAAIFGPRNVAHPQKRGCAPSSLRETLRWMEDNGLIVIRREGRGVTSVYGFGDEMYHILTTGDFSPAFRAKLQATTSASKPFFRLRHRGFTPRKHGIDGVEISIGPYYRVPQAMAVVEQHLPQTVMPVIWHLLRNTLGRGTWEHPSLGYCKLGTKSAARLYGPARTTAPTKRGRRVNTVRGAVDGAVVSGLIDRKLVGETTHISIGPELWLVLRTGAFSPEMAMLLGAEPARVTPSRNQRRESRLDYLERLVREGDLPLGEVISALNYVSRRVDRADSGFARQ